MLTRQHRLLVLNFAGSKRETKWFGLYKFKISFPADSILINFTIHFNICHMDKPQTSDDI